MTARIMPTLSKLTPNRDYELIILAFIGILLVVRLIGWDITDCILIECINRLI